jgi:hypothetical protein
MTHAHAPLSAQASRRLTLDTEPYLSCDDCFDLVDGYVEALLADPDHTTADMADVADVAEMVPMRTHLTGCAACAEEAASLIAFVAEQDGLDPRPALRRLEDQT